MYMTKGYYIFQTKSSFWSGKVKVVFQYIIWHPMMALWNSLYRMASNFLYELRCMRTWKITSMCGPFTFKEPSLCWTPYHMIVNKWGPSIYWEVICISTCTSQQYISRKYNLLPYWKIIEIITTYCFTVQQHFCTLI